MLVQSMLSHGIDTWSLSVKKIDDKTCEFTNMVHSSGTPELMDFLGKQGILGEIFQAAPLVNLFQKTITGKRRLSSQKASNRHALRRK
jgi:hypothetical protein